MVTSLRENPGTTQLQMLTACLAILVAVVLFLAPPNVQAQTFTVLHTFEDGQDGTKPFTGVAIDRAGNLYGVAYGGGGTGGTCYLGCGTAFKLTKHGGSWIYSTIYRYQGPPDGAYPAGIMIGPDGSLYGATYGGGIVNQGSCVLDVYGCGTVFKIQPPANFCKTADCPGMRACSIASPAKNGDAGGPYNGDLIFDGAGSLYGTTEEGGAHQAGAAYKLTPSSGGWSESVIYSFDPSGFSIPQTGLILDHSGNLYGTTIAGSNYDGATYQLSPSQSGYIATVLFASQCSEPAGCYPGSLTFDPSGNIVGATQLGTGYYNGSVYELVASSGWSSEHHLQFHRAAGRKRGSAGDGCRG